jgi:hypothetical protein
MAVCKIKFQHVIDAPIVDRVYYEEVDDNVAMSLSLAVDLGPLTYEQDINKLLDVQDESLDRDQDSNYNEDDDGGDWETYSKTEVKSEKYVSEDNSSE